MDWISTLIGALEYLGITKERVVPNLILFAVAYWLISKKVDKFAETLENVKRSILEIHTTLKAKWKLTFDQTIDKYSRANSPITLRDEYSPFITKTGINKQVDEKENELVQWLKSQNPDTGIDAQDKISNLVLSDDIKKYLDLTEYKQYLYKKGKTQKDAYGILAVYLFERLIPKVFPGK